MALDLPQGELSEEMQAYFAKCDEKIGFVPNVLRAYAHDNAKLEAFAAFYNDLMLAPSGLSKLEREMIAVAVSSQNRCYYCLVGARRRRAPALGRSGARRDDGDELSRRRARAAPPGHARFRGASSREAPWTVEEADREALAGGRLLATATSGTSPRSQLLQHVEPHGLGGRHAAEPEYHARRAEARSSNAGATCGGRVPKEAGPRDGARQKKGRLEGGL